MSPNTLRKSSQLVLAASLLVLLPAIAHADDAQRPPREQNAVELTDLVQLDVQVVEVAAKTLTAAKDKTADDKSIVDAVRKAVDDGTAHDRYILETPMLVGRPLQWTAGTREPFVSSRRTSKDGRTNSAMEYEDIGCRIELRSQWMGSTPEHGVHMNWNVELSDLNTSSGVRITDDLDATVFTSQKFTIGNVLALNHTMAFRAGVQRPQSNESLTTVIIATLTAIPPKSSTG